MRPFEGEVLTGKIRSCSDDGVYGNTKTVAFSFLNLLIVDMEFFEDILIPASCLQSGTYLYFSLSHSLHLIIYFF